MIIIEDALPLYSWAVRETRQLNHEEWTELYDWWLANVKSGYLVTDFPATRFLAFIGDDDEAMAMKLRWG